MKLHTGPLKHPVTVVTKTPGYRWQPHDGPESYVECPTWISRNVRRMFGLSAGRWFIGFMLTEQPEFERHRKGDQP